MEERSEERSKERSGEKSDEKSGITGGVDNARDDFEVLARRIEEGLDIVRKFNSLMKEAVIGPDCTDPEICHADCCFIHIDIPRFLARYYVEKGWAKPEDFIGGNVFVYRIAVDMKKLRCVFYDPQINGCSLHHTGMKPPQCWVYPTGLDPDDIKTNCKRAGGWDVVDKSKLKKASALMAEFVSLCKSEYNGFFSRDHLDLLIERSESFIKQSRGDIAPYSITGITFKWDHFEMQIGEGYHLSGRKICSAVKNSGYDCNRNYLECKSVCGSFRNELFENMRRNLYKIIIERGASEIIPLSELLGQGSGA